MKCDIRKYGMQRVKPSDRDKWSSCGGSNPCKHGKKDVINCLIEYGGRGDEMIRLS